RHHRRMLSTANSTPPPRPPRIPKGANELFLLGVNGHDRVAGPQERLDPGIDVAELRVSVRMLGSLEPAPLRLRNRWARRHTRIVSHASERTPHQDAGH